MSKEQYNSIDDWFREAAEQPGPPVNDAAWQAMEAKLDGQKKRRRAIFWWWFGGMFLAGGIFMLGRMNFEFNNNQSWPNSELPSKTQIAKQEKKSGTQASTPSDPTTGIVGKEKADR